MRLILTVTYVFDLFTDDEEKLNEMSLACEKGKNELNSSSSVLSSTSVNSPSTGGGGGGGGAGPKFGAEGYNINRMLALSEKSRTVNQKSHSQVGHLTISSVHVKSQFV